MKPTLLLAFISLSFTIAPAQDSYTPEPGTPVRKAILKALRIPVQDEIGQPVKFKIDHFKVSGDWAFLKGKPLTATSGPIDYSKTPLAEDAETADELLVAVMFKKNGKWQALRHAIFTTDVWWHGIHEELGAPVGIFDYAQ